MIVDLPDTTTTTAVNKKLDELREKIGAVAMGRVLTLIIAPDSEAMLEESIEAANDASHEHPSRIIVTMRGDPYADRPRLDAQLRVGADAGAGEFVVLRLSGPLAGHADSVVIPFLLPDIPVVAWWPDIAPAVPAQDALGKLAIRRITDATNAIDPLSAIKSRLRRRRHRSGLEPHHLLACAAHVGRRPAATRADRVGAGVRLEDRTGARRPSRLASQPDRRSGATGGRRTQSRAGAQQRDHRAKPSPGGNHGHPDPDGQARRSGSFGAQGNR